MSYPGVRRRALQRRPPEAQIGRTPGNATASARMVRVTSIGKNASRHFCPRCGLRYKLCTCQDDAA